MLELKVNPFEDALMAPAMDRFSVQIKGLLQQFKKNNIDLNALKARLSSVLIDALQLAVERGYNLAIQKGGLKTKPGDVSGLKHRAQYRAKQAAQLICKSSAKALQIYAAITEENVASKKRSEGIVQFEMPRMMFMGMRKGWGRITGTRMPTKSWFVVSQNPCEACQENEDQGAIPLDDPFESGDYEPGIHPGCDCVLGLFI